jgi:hypothetical protein
MNFVHLLGLFLFKVWVFLLIWNYAIASTFPFVNEVDFFKALAIMLLIELFALVKYKRCNIN